MAIYYINYRHRAQVNSLHSNIKLINYRRNIFAKDWMGCCLTFRKEQVEVINKIDHKQWYKINYQDMMYEVYQVIAKMTHQCKRPLHEFLKRYGGESQLEILRVTKEIKLYEPYKDRKSIGHRFYAKGMKKVYRDGKMEFYHEDYLLEYIKTADNIERLMQDNEKIKKHLGLVKTPQSMNQKRLGDWL